MAIKYEKIVGLEKARTMKLLKNLCNYIMDDEQRLSTYYKRNPQHRCEKIFREIGFPTPMTLSMSGRKQSLPNMPHERCTMLTANTLQYIFYNKVGDYSEDQYADIMRSAGFNDEEIQQHLCGNLF